MKKRILPLLFVLSSLTNLFAQSILVVPQGYNTSGTNLTSKILFHPDSLVVLTWNSDVTSKSVKIKIGTTSGNYNITNSSFPMSVSGVTKSFRGSNSGLSTGRYYGILTNSSSDNLNDIINDNGKEYSNEFQFVVTATSGAVASSPIGTILESTPTFNWSSVPGVVSYWLLVSSTPFEVKTDDNGDLLIEGANLIWNYTTNQTSAQYGDVNSLNPYDNGVPAPLLPGETYNFVILNLYEENNPIFGSSVISGINAFVYENDVSEFPVPNLVSPANNTAFDDEGTITFSWESVEWASFYSFHLFERVTSFGGNDQTIDIPIYSTTTTNNLIDFEARSKLNKGTYVWFIIPNSSQGAGSVSETYEFFYNKRLGVFRLQAYSTLDNTNLLNYEGRAIAVIDGVTPATPYLVSDSQTYTDSIALGTYQFVGSKVGFQDTTISVIIDANATVSNPQIIKFPLTPLPSTLSGTILESGNNLPISNVLVEIINKVTDEKKSTITSSTGAFSLSTTIGQYTLRVSKAGYISADEQTVNATSGQVNLSTITLVKDEVSISGKISNDLGQPIQLATVTATKGNTVQQQNSSGDGSYNFVLSSGEWVIEVSKTGFVSQATLNLSLSTGDNLQNQNMVLIPRANQVSGTVYKIIKNSDGTTSSISFSDVTVTAEPTLGTPTTALSSSVGDFTFSLRQGTYTFSVAKNGFSASDPVQLTLGIGETLDNLSFNLTPNPSSVSGKITTSGGDATDDVLIEVLGIATTKSDLNGLYTLSLPEGTHKISISKSGYISPTPQTLSVEPGEAISGINFELSPNAGIISGKITSTGQALSNALVKAVSGNTELTTNTDVSGNYTFNVQPNSWEISVSKSGFLSSSTQTITIGPGQQSLTNNFSLVQNIASITGVVKVGETLERNVNVLISNKTTNVEVLNTVTDVNGKFTASLEAGIEYKIVVSKSGYSSSSKYTASLTPESSTAISFEITANPSSVSGKIISNNNDLIKDAVIKIYSGSNVITEVSSDDNGLYTSGLSSGSYKIVASKSGYLSDSSNVTATVGQNLQSIDLTLTENFATIAGTVTSGSSGLSDVLVNLISPNGGKTKFTLSDGSFLVNKLLGSTYQISFSKTGYSDTTFVDYQINDGDSKTISVSLEMLNGKISGKITTASGSAVKDATVKAIADDGSLFYSSSNASGEYAIPSLKSGNYKVSASKTNFRTTAETSVTIAPASLEVVADITDLKENVAEISGVVKDKSSSEPLVGATVELISNNDSYSASSNNLGEFKFTNVAPGEFRLLGTLDKYSSSDIAISVLENTTTITQDIQLSKISGSIVGTVVNQFGEALTISATVIANSKSTSYSIQAGNGGVFEFNEVPPDTYNVKTDIYSEGYVNGETSNIIVTPNSQQDIGNLTVNVNRSKIIGNVGTDNASVTLSDNSDNVIKVVQSTSTGDFSFTFLANGTYNLKPTKEGFEFTPASKSVTLGVNDEQEINFTSTAKIGDIVVFTKDENNSPLAQVAISLVNADTNYVKNGTTNSEGFAMFLDIPSDSYIITPSLAEYSSSPINVTKTLNSLDSINVSFTLTKNQAQISGTTFKLVSGGTNVPLGKVTVSAKRKDSGNITSNEVYRAISDSITGKYLLENLPKNSFTVTASRTGFEQQVVELNLSDVDKVTQDFVLTPSVINLKGKVISKIIDDVNNLTLKAVSSYGEYFISTNSNGNYTFTELPIGSGATDTTLYQISLVDGNSSSLTKLVTIPSSEINTTITVDDFLLPSGELQFVITDCVDPLSGVEVTLLNPNGTTTKRITESDGLFLSSNKLFAGTYSLNLTKAEYLTPNNQSLNFTLESDTSALSATVKMPFRFIPASEILADENTIIEVLFKGNCTLNNAVGKLFYKISSQSQFDEIAMVVGDTAIVGNIPVLNSVEEVSYYVEVTVDSIKYSSPEYKIIPKAAGILKSLALTPELNNTALRIGDKYSVTLIIRDGLQESLSDKFIGTTATGEITWNTPEEIEVTNEDETNPTEVVISPTAAGDYTISVTAKLNGISVVSEIVLSVSDLQLSSLSLSSPNTQISNRANGIQFSISGADTSGRSITLGNSLVWDVEPRAAISETDYEVFKTTGFFRPVDSTFIGSILITATDEISDLATETSVSIFADIYPTTSVELSNKAGTFITILPNSVNIPIQLNLNNSEIKSVKKYITPRGESVKFIVSDFAYRLSYSASTALPGDSLQVGGIIQMPIDASLRFNEGKKGIAFYDSEETEWVIVSEVLEADPSLSKISNLNLSYNKLAKFGEYAVVSRNEPLGLRYLSILPSPFSPTVAPVKIGYFLTSDAPPATMEIKIYNMNGELVKTILENDVQFPGRYGSSSSLKEITWDGTTDGNNLARNGRYIVRLKAKDGKNEIEELIQVVLIK